MPPPGTGGQIVNRIGVINHDGATAVQMRSTPSTGSSGNVLRGLPFNTHLQVIRSYSDGWSYVSTRDGQLGYVSSLYIWTQLPEPTAQIHRVQPGLAGTAIAIAEQYYAQTSYDWGHDLRYYVNVLAHANRRQVPASQGWKNVRFQANNLIWIPGRRYADSLTEIDSGSISFELFSAIGNAFQRFAQLCTDIADAVTMSLDYLGPAIARHVTAAIKETLVSLAVLAVGAIAILAVSTAVGAIIGALGGGVGAAPGAAAGFQVGLAILDWLGLAMLVGWIAASLRDIGVAFGQFISTVWSAHGNRGILDRAAQQFADAVGKLFKALTEALLMFAAAKGIGALVSATRGTPFGRALGEKPFMQWLEKNNVAYRNKWEGPLKPPAVVLRRIYRGVEIVDARNSPLGELDGVDVGRRMFIENKTASGINKIDPRTGRPFNNSTPADWAQKQIVGKTKVRIKNLTSAAATRPTVGGSPDVPTLAELQGIKRLHFRIDGDSPALRNAVAQSLAALAKEYPGWQFTAEFGANLLLPPVPDRDD
ncbi:MAG: SH3 domain-containing protein [Minicystis sp.]